MPEMEIGDRYRVNFVCKFASQYSQNVREFIVTAKTGPIVDDTFLLALDNIIAPLYKAILPEVCTYEGSKMTRITPTLGVPVTETGNLGNGLVESDPHPPQVSIIAKLRGQVGGRRGLGRIYFPYVPVSFTDADTFLNVGNIVLYTALAGEMAGEESYAVGADSLGVSWGHLLAGTSTFDEWTLTSIRRALATQRRRAFVNRGDANPLE